MAAAHPKIFINVWTRPQNDPRLISGKGKIYAGRAQGGQTPTTDRLKITEICPIIKRQAEHASIPMWGYRRER